MHITENTCRLLRDELNNVLPSIGEKLRLIIKVGSMRYDRNSITFSTACSAVGEGVDATDPKAVAKMEFQRYAARFHGEPDWLGQKVYIRNAVYTIIGINPSAKKNAFLIQKGSEDTTYSADVYTVRLGLTNYQAHLAKTCDTRK